CSHTADRGLRSLPAPWSWTLRARGATGHLARPALSGSDNALLLLDAVQILLVLLVLLAVAGIRLWPVRLMMLNGQRPAYVAGEQRVAGSGRAITPVREQERSQHATGDVNVGDVGILDMPSHNDLVNVPEILR